MTETERLRAMLDERGVFWTEHIELQGVITVWMGWQFFEGTAEYNMGWTLLSMADATPEQAVEATLGRGTCRLVPTRDKPRSKVPTLTCSECGWWTDEIGKTWNYCPSCGRRVIA